MDLNIISLYEYANEVAIISFGFIGGVYFAFSFFVMHSLNKNNPSEAIKIMNSINEVILKSPFIILFFFSSFIALVLFFDNLISKTLISDQGFASLIFLVGMFLCTALKNVPLNRKLNDFNDSKNDPEAEWMYYYKHWLKWNHVRTASCFISMLLLVLS